MTKRKSIDIAQQQKDIGEKLKKKRNKLGYTMDGLTAGANICKHTVVKLENGKGGKVDSLLTYLDILGLKLTID